jgi:hypothetical protein
MPFGESTSDDSLERPKSSFLASFESTCIMDKSSRAGTGTP